MKRRITKLGLISLAAAGLAIGCSDTEFQGSSPKKPAEKRQVVPVHKTLSLTCSDDQPETELVTDVNGSSKTSVVLKGEFCNLKEEAVSGELHVLFVLDFSGSMYDNDPLVGDSCGRLKAAEAITSKLKATIQDGVNVDVGILPFGTTALTATPLQAMDSFSSQLTSAAFCGNAGGATNYDDAFAKAKDMLAPLSGNSVIYFISDGVPTVSGAGLFGFGTSEEPDAAKNKGVSSAKALRDAIGDKLDLNAIYLGNIDPSGGGVQPDLLGFDPQDYLEQITGDAAKVRLVTNAEDLADQIVSFETPEVLTIDSSSVVGIHKASAYGQKEIELTYIKPDPAREGVWIFETKPFELFGESGRITENEVVLTVEASDGQKQTARVRIQFEIDEEGNIRKL